MGERGPARLPAAVAKARGTYRADRHGSGDVFAPEARVPDPPEWWEAGSPVLEEWERITGELLAWGLVTELDRGALIIYCEAWGTHRDMQATIEEEGPILLAPATGRLYTHPAVSQRDAAWKTMLDVGKRFGFSPSDRNGVKVPKPPKVESPVGAWSALKGGA